MIQRSISCPYEHYYMNQAGRGIGVIYKGDPHQRGHGIGSFLGGLFRSVLPLFVGGARAVGKELLHTGVGVMKDMIDARPMNDSIKTRLKTATSNLKRKADEKLDNIMSGSGYKIKRQRKRVFIRSKALRAKSSKLKINKDIFEN